jgi:hypothetical protein
MEALRTAAEAAGQQHIFSAWEQLPSAEQRALLDDLAEIDLHYVASVFRASTAPAGWMARPQNLIRLHIRHILRTRTDGPDRRSVKATTAG